MFASWLRRFTAAKDGGYAHREIAELTGVPVGTVKSRISAAMRRLQAELSPEMPL